MDDTLKFIVPNRRVGLIIGPRGAHIAELQQKSGARISVDKESRTENEVTIKGAQAAVATAKEMIDEMIAKQEQEERDSAARHTASRAPQGGGAAAHTYGNRMGMGGPSPPPGNMGGPPPGTMGGPPPGTMGAPPPGNMGGP